MFRFHLNSLCVDCQTIVHPVQTIFDIDKINSTGNGTELRICQPFFLLYETCQLNLIRTLLQSARTTSVRSCSTILNISNCCPSFESENLYWEGVVYCPQYSLYNFGMDLFMCLGHIGHSDFGHFGPFGLLSPLHATEIGQNSGDFFMDVPLRLSYARF